MGEKFVKNMQRNGFSPKIFDLDYSVAESDGSYGSFADKFE